MKNNNRKISLNIKEFANFKSVIFTPLLIKNEKPDDYDAEGCSRLDCSIGYYTVSIFITTRMVRIAENYFIHSEMPVENWQKFLSRFSSAIDYKLCLIEKYSNYAYIIHNRIVHFYAEMLRESSNIEFFTRNFVQDHLLNLDHSALPHTENENCDYSILDYNVCYLINSEIRLNMAYQIYLDAYTMHLIDVLKTFDSQ